MCGQIQATARQVIPQDLDGFQSGFKLLIMGKILMQQTVINFNAAFRDGLDQLGLGSFNLVKKCG